MNPEHFFEQAEKLLRPSYPGPLRQVDLRRAVSAAYYGVFHQLSRALADEFVGRTQTMSFRYALVYRSVEHGGLKALCKEVTKLRPSDRYKAYLPPHVFGADFKTFAEFVVELQQRRHEADYDPGARLNRLDVQALISAARIAVDRFAAFSEQSRAAFLTLLLCPPR